MYRSQAAQTQQAPSGMIPLGARILSVSVPRAG